MFGYIDLEKIYWIPHFAGAKHRIDCGQNHSGNGDNGSFLTSTLGNSLIFWLEVNTSAGDTNRLFFPADLLSVVNLGQQHSRLEEPS